MIRITPNNKHDFARDSYAAVYSLAKEEEARYHARHQQIQNHRTTRRDGRFRSVRPFYAGARYFAHLRGAPLPRHWHRDHGYTFGQLEIFCDGYTGRSGSDWILAEDGICPT